VSNLKKVLLACEVLEDYLRPLLSESTSATFFDFGLHDQPSRMRPTLQQMLDALPEPSTVLIGYGLCGNGVVGLEAGPHTLVLPKAHDCIGMTFGSNQAHAAELAAHPGTYYLTRGWLGTGNDPLEQYERYIDRYGRERAGRVVDALYGAYERVCLVAFSAEELAAVRPLAAPVVRFFRDRFQLEYVERIGDSSFIERLMGDGPKDGAEFIVIPSGGVVSQEIFF
jgi:hypothetical protein